MRYMLNIFIFSVTCILWIGKGKKYVIFIRSSFNAIKIIFILDLSLQNWAIFIFIF